MRRWTALVLLLAAAACMGTAAVPTVSDIESLDSTHASVLWRYKVSTPSYIRILFGTSSGVYPYATQSHSSLYENNLWAIIPVTGLQPGTTYYFRMTARPNAANDADICNFDACGSVEQVFTTPTEPYPHPELPAQPAPYQAAHPDTNGYTVVPMKVHTDGSCVAAAAVASRPGWSASVSPNDSLQTVLNKIGYGTVVEFPQASSCAVSETNAFWHTGVVLPNKAMDGAAGGDMDSPAHRWIVLRTAGAESDFPPFGVRTSPEMASKYAKLVAQTPGFKRPDGSSNWTGQIFHGSRDGSVLPHHYWIENLELTHRSDTQLYPADVVDPVAFTMLVVVKDASYLVLDRIYAHGGGFPARIAGGIWAGGNNSAVLSCYFNFDFWRVATWPTANPTITGGGTGLSIPQQTFKRNYFDSPIGMSAPASLTLTAPAGASGTVRGYLGPVGLLVEYTNGEVVSVACSGCTAQGVAAHSTPYNYYNWFTATIANGRISQISGKIAEWETTYADWAPWGFTLGWGAKMLVENNHFEGPGMSIYIEPDGVRDDVVFRRNLIYWPQDHLPRTDNPKWNGLRYNVRNPFEAKRGRRWLMDGNIFDGAWSHQNQGQPIMIWGVGSYSYKDTQIGVLDWTVTNNVVRNAAVMGQFGGPWAKRALIANNLAYNLNRDFWDDGNGSPGIFWSGHWMLSEAPEDVTMRNNTLGPARGLGPAILFTGGPSGPGEGLRVQDNLIYVNLGKGSSHGPVMLYEAQNEAAHPRIPAFTGTTAAAILGSVYVRAGASVVSNFLFGNNVLIGGQTQRSTTAWRDQTQSEINEYAKQLTGNFLPEGGTVAARETAAGLANASRNDYRLAEGSPYKTSATSGGSIGVNYADLEAALGLVSNVAVTAGATSALVSYTAPDGKACWVETSSDGAVWTRKRDDGGTQGRPSPLLAAARVGAREGGEMRRAVPVEGLNTATEYRYRILCYFAQRLTDGNSSEYRPDQITEDRFTTLQGSR